MAKKSRSSGSKPAIASGLERIAATIGLLLALGIFGVIGWQAQNGQHEQPPALVASVERVTANTGGYVVEVTVQNRSDATAAGVVIEGELKAGSSGEKSQATISYIPGRSRRSAGLIFRDDPRSASLDLRVLGFERP